MGEPEGFRKFFNLQYVKMKKLAAVGSLILLALNLSFSIYPYMEFRLPDMVFGTIPKTYFAIPLLFLLILLSIWFFAWIYVRVLEMYRTECRADIIYNPYAVYAINPFQEMWFREIYLPLLKDHPEHYKRVKNWCDLGYIPKDDFPEYLKKYYITDKESRL